MTTAFIRVTDMIKIGPAGSGALGHLDAIRKVVRMKLDCMEVQFTYGVRMTKDTAKAMGALAREKGIMLSAHAPYYINLASDQKDKRTTSKRRILDSCQMADALGARNVVFHAGFYQGKSVDSTFGRIKETIMEMQETIRRKKWEVMLCPEVTGREAQFGSLKELLKMMDETGCGLTVDFSHLYARQQGKIDYGKVLDNLPDAFHSHFSGIEYGERGEKRHIATTKKFFEPLAKELVKRELQVTMISESPRPYRDAAMMRRLIRRLQGEERNGLP